jgi:hypothetical protein
MEQKFDLINCTDYQKPVFAAQCLEVMQELSGQTFLPHSQLVTM